MEDYQVLAKIIQDYPDALSERKKLHALFSDYFPQDRLKRNTLLMVFDDGIVTEMKGLTQMDQIVMHRFVKSVEQGYGIRTRNAENAVFTWAQAMGLQLDNNMPSARYGGAPEERAAEDERVKEWEAVDSDSLYECEETPRGLKILKFVDFDEDVVVIPNVIEGKKVIAVGNHAFKGCVGIEQIIISEGIEVLGNGVFLNCKRLKEAVLPSTLRRIGTTDPTGCPAILGSMTKLEGAFEYTALESIKIPDRVGYVGENTFAGCGKLKKAVLPPKLKEIHKSTFQWCKSLEEVVLPRDLEAVRISAFEGCESIKNIDLPEGVMSIEEGAFAGCKNLESIYIPDSVVEIGGGKGGNGFLQTFGEPEERREDLTILCNAGSYAMQYARTQQIRCASARY
ncbi:MAG: leucine-rich repeat domain-containing protein [Lachnospiraceae bacterium]|nr:leucine-rich repeat domain-containing protein [Lachnospiraceae bacterium]